MKQSIIVIKEKNSARTDIANLIVSVRIIYPNHFEIVVGSPGLRNVVADMNIGDAVLFETPNDGILEVRALSMDALKVELLVSQVSPRLGIVGALVDEDPNNSPFTSDELVHITQSITSVALELGQRSDIVPEQLELINRKLSEIEAASQRLGRKDWINYVAGTLTSMCVSAAFAPDVSKAIFQSVGSAFSWLFSNALRLLA
ncbi:MAG: hypothetical protein WC880_05305 [Candidatus Paceibacterota bacterium]